MADKRITDVDFISSLASDESFFVNQNNTLKQINKSDIIFNIANGGTGATTAAEALVNLGIIDWFGQGVSIPSNSDLNTYTTVGKYYVVNAETAETITSAPTTTSNYVLFVFSRTNSSMITQLAITLNGVIFTRGINSSGTWQEWRRSLQLKSSEDALGISKGGTGATTAAAALTNLGLNIDGIQVVNVLPSDASSHPNTLYLVTG